MTAPVTYPSAVDALTALRVQASAAYTDVVREWYETPEGPAKDALWALVNINLTALHVLRDFRPQVAS